MIADLKPYPKLKDSRVQWLGEVPGHWEVSKIKSLARPGYKTFVDGDWIESPYITPDGIRLIQTGNIGTGEYREKGFRYISEETFKNFCCTEVEPDDILICRLGEPVARTCLAPRIGKRMITSVDVCILKPRAEADAKFFVYSMSSRRYLDWVGSLVRGSTRDRVSRSMLGSFAVPVPPLPEQFAIVRFLDHADRRIRRYIRAKQKLIALLEEQKQAIIHQAVTGQIDVRTGQPYPAYKDSGVEWLGKVPEHWEIVRLKFVLSRSTRNGLFKKKSEFGDGAPLINVSDIYSERFQIDPASLEQVRASPEEIQRFRVQSGDIFFVRSSLKLEGTGRSAVAIGCSLDTLFECHLVQARLDRRRVNAHYLIIQLNSNATRHHLISQANVVTMATVAQNVISTCPVLVPPLREQEKLVDWIHIQLSSIALAIDQSNREISVLREYRTRLIADVVTGQLDVREAAAAILEETDAPTQVKGTGAMEREDSTEMKREVTL